MLRREHSMNIAELIEKAGLIDYNDLIFEERERKEGRKNGIESMKNELNQRAN